MGLDQSLFARPDNNDHELGTWRKFNALQNYMEVNFGNGGEDGINCKEIYLSEEVIDDLISILKKVSADHSLAAELFPNTEGFFYGSQEYDDNYFEDVERSIVTFEAAKKDSDECIIYYHCWY